MSSAAAVSRAERDKARAVREAGEAYKSAGGGLSDLQASFTKAQASFGTGLKLNLGLAGIGLLPAAATAITDVAGAVQQLAGAGLALPGIFAGIASSVGVGALGMHGMSDALEAVNKAADGTEASVTAANKALADLAPAQADTVKTVAGLKGTFTELRNIAGNNMFAGVSDGLKGLVAADLPAVTRGVDGISKGINQNLLQAMNSLGSSSSQGFLDRIFGNTATAQAQLTAAIDPAIHAIGTLTTAGTDSLPRLASAVGDVADRFDRFITAADGDGRLDRWIDDGLTGFTQLGNTVLNIGQSVTALTQAAGGGAGLLGTLESATAKMSLFLNSTDGQTKLQNYFAEGRDMLGQLKDIATTAGPVVAGVFRAGVSAANAWLPIVRQGLDILNRIPGGAEAAVTAFIAWKTMQGPLQLLKMLGDVNNALGVGLPNAATRGANGISSALSKVAVPAWLTFLMYDAGKSVYDNATKDFAQFPGQQTATDPQGKLGELTRNNTGTIVMGVPSSAGAFSSNKLPVAAPDQYGGPNAQRDRYGFRLPTAPAGGLPGAQADRRGGATYSALNPTAPGVTPYVPPTVTDGGSGGGSGSTATPFVDPSKYLMGDPLAGLPAAAAGVDQQALYDADSKLLTATHNLEQKRLANQVLEAKGNATQQELLTARNDLQEAERAQWAAQQDAILARTGQMQQATSKMSDAVGGLDAIFAPLDQDFGISKGIPGLVENLVKTFGNLALGSAIASNPSLQAAALGLLSNGASTMGPSPLGGGVGMPAYSAAAMPGESGRDFAHRAMMPYWQSQGFTVGDHAADKYGEHQNGAIDIMVGSIAEGNRVLSQVLSDPNVYGAIFNRTSYGYGHGTTGTPMPDRGSPTQNHEDHVHAFYKPGNPGNITPLPGGFGAAGYTTSSGTVPVTVVSAPGMAGMGLSSQQWNAIAGAEASGNWAANTGNGYSGGLQFSPSTWNSYGGSQYAPEAWMASPQQQMAVGNNVLAGQGPGAWPATSAAHPDWFQPGAAGALPTLPAGFGGQGYPGPLTAGPGIGAAAGGPAGFDTGLAPVATPGGAGPGLGGAPMAAAMAAANAFAPGSGAALQLANRAIQFGGQAAAIGVQGLMETFLPSGSPLGAAGNSWFGKLAGGLAGARPAKNNTAGGGGLGQAQGAPQMPGSAGAQNTRNTTVNNTVNLTNNKADEDQNGKTIEKHLSYMYQGPGR
ncbi:transglycosylase family protein [Mycolicibacterium grossiae]|uniref:transglycosylase family protein n=1 Tax=Mycolicibacterium grossiae TaxID=1552759 RepID=UPI002734C6A6|nr:transglycosylase family protein [Mycolicibacterium grossiae]